MKTVGIIAEYNPFHNGHLYQINQIKEQTNADYVIVVMSGNFVQRGTPAILHKYARTKMALSNQVDAVFELPVCYATASAEFFAYGAVSLLNSLGVVDYLCFGSECGEIKQLEVIAAHITEESDEYKEALLRYQKLGETYPKARAHAMQETLSHVVKDADLLNEVLSSPNNILGIEYIKALKKLKSNMQPITIKRTGGDYHSESMEDANPSATAIRKHILEQHSTMQLMNLPDSSKEILEDCYNHSYPVTIDDFSSLLYYQLLQQREQLSIFCDVSEDLSNRIQNLLSPGIVFSTFAEELKTKQLTQTRINRALLHILLDIKQSDFKAIYKKNIMYARLLGFNKSSSAILKEIQIKDNIPVITKVADAVSILEQEAYAMFQKDIQRSHIYNQIVASKFHEKIADEYTIGPVII